MGSAGQEELFAAPADHVWQHHFYDFNLWSKQKWSEKLWYMHRNPVKRGLGAGTRTVGVEQLSSVRLRGNRSGEVEPLASKRYTANRDGGPSKYRSPKEQFYEENGHSSDCKSRDAVHGSIGSERDGVEHDAEYRNTARIRQLKSSGDGWSIRRRFIARSR